MMVRDRLELSEYQVRLASSSPPSSDDLRLARALSVGSEEPRLGLRWLAGEEIEITASSWVGVVRLSTMDVHITPKYVGGGLQLLKLVDYTNNTSIARQLENVRPLYADGDNLVDLVCRLLADQASTLLRQGLLRSYRNDSDELSVLRGRLDYREQFLRRFGQIDRLHCRFDEHDADIPENQLVCAALGIAMTIVVEPQLRRELNRLRTIFAEACRPPTLSAAHYRELIAYGRLNERYRTVHELCYLILDSTAFDDLFDTRGTTKVCSFLLNMNTLFERFVTRLLSDALDGSGLRVSSQERLSATIIDAASRRTYANIVPDLVVTVDAAGGDWEHHVPIDVKYKLYDDRKLSTGDIYQAFTYALALSRGRAEGRAGIVYPGERTGITRTLEINPTTAPTRARIVSASLDVRGILSEIGSDGSISEYVRNEVQTIARIVAAGSALTLQNV